MKSSFNNNHTLVKYYLSAVIILFFACDTSLSPVVEGPSIYSYYGILNIDNPVNFVRINDIKTPSNSIEEEELNVTVTLTDLNSDETFFLRDSLIYFEDEFLTHNFYLNKPINFGTDYLLILENDMGFRDSVFSTTPEKATVTIVNDNQKCNVPFFIELSPVNDMENEIIEFEVEFYYDSTFFASDAAQSITIDDESITYEFTPNQVIQSAFGDIAGVPNCTQLLSNDLTFRYTHIGPSGDDQSQLIREALGIPSAFERNIIGLYTDEFVFEIDTVPPPPFPSKIN